MKTCSVTVEHSIDVQLASNPGLPRPDKNRGEEGLGSRLMFSERVTCIHR